VGPTARARRILVAFAAIASFYAVSAVPANAGPVSTRLSYATGEIVPIPAAVPHEEGDMVDRRIIPDLRWIAAHFPIYITDGYSGPLPNGEHVGCDNCHVKGSDHYNGLAVDIVPLNGSAKCDLSWEHAAAPQFQLAEWVEVFPVAGSTASKQPPPRHKRAKTPPAPPPGPAGGISTIHSGGLSARGD
jgi:hypothetical protein